MRGFLLVSILVAASLAGCTSANLPDTTTTEPMPAAVSTVPANITATEAVTGSFAGANLLNQGAPFPDQGVCAPAATAKCFHYAFTVNATAIGNATEGVSTVATLSWGLQASDFDLYVMQNGTVISQDGINQPTDVPTTTQVLHATLPAGNYEFVVVAWSVVQDTFVFEATFEA